MLDNRNLYNVSYGNIMTRAGYNLVSTYANSSSAKELCRLIGITLGAPVQFLNSATQRHMSSFACLLYLFEKEYIGNNAEPGAWGADYTNMYIREGQQKYWMVNVDDTDIMCIAYNAIRAGDDWFVFNRLVEKLTVIEWSRFADYIVYLMENRNIGLEKLESILSNCQSGAALKAIMDAIHAHMNNDYVRNNMQNLRASAGFDELCQTVTAKIVATLPQG